MSDKRPILTYEAQINRVLPGLIPEIREQVLADAKARIGRLAAPNGSYGEAEWGFLRGVTAALAALTQPQTEKPDCDCDNREQWCGKTPCHNYHGGGAATVTVELTRDEAKVLLMADHHVECDEKLEALQDSASDKIEAALADTEPGPYAKAFRERVCPVPEFPGIEVHINGNPDMDPETAETLREAMKRAYRYMAEKDSTGTAPQRPKADPNPEAWDEKDEAYLQAVAPAPQTEGECPECEGTGKVTTTMVNDWLICPTCSGTGKEGEK